MGHGLNFPRCPSPNHNARPYGARVDTIIIHNISLPPGDFNPRWVRALFQNRLPANHHPYFLPIAKLKVSAHFYIQRNARVVQCVPLHRRAWHAGQSHWQHQTNLNDTSIGIELIGDDLTPFTHGQYLALARLIKQLAKAYPVTQILGHSDIAPGRKTDPGPCFDWAHLIGYLPKQIACPAFTDISEQVF